VKKTKWLGATGAVVALGVGGFLAVPYTSANGTTPPIVAGSGSSASCTITGTVKISPGLANDWDQSAHSSDPGDAQATGGVVSKDAQTYTGNATITAAMASIPDTPYSAGFTKVTTTSKTVAVCTGTATDGAHSTSVDGATITSQSISDGTNEATCSGLNANTGSTPLHSDIKWTSTGPFKIAPSSVTSTVSQLLDSHGAGFDVSSSGGTGSFAGGTGETKAYVDNVAIASISGAAATTANPTAINPLLGIASLCEPTVTGKFAPAALGAGDSVAIKLKKPKGLKAITIGEGTFDNTHTPSTLVTSVP